MPPNAVCSMPSAFGIGFIFNAVGIADAVTSIIRTSEVWVRGMDGWNSNIILRVGDEKNWQPFSNGAEQVVSKLAEFYYHATSHCFQIQICTRPESNCIHVSLFIKKQHIEKIIYLKKVNDSLIRPLMFEALHGAGLGSAKRLM